MEPGTKLKANTMYYTKDGRGTVIKWNRGYVLGERDKEAIITPWLTDTTDVWCAGGISRHIKDIAETKADAQSIRY